MTPPVQIAIDSLLETAVGPAGASADALLPGGVLAERFRAAWAEVGERRASGEIGFFSLPWDGAALDAIRARAKQWDPEFDALVVVGIGGSSLGVRAIAEALCGPWWNERSREERGGRPRLYLLENPDPDTVSALLSRLELSRTLINVISKSGSTAETMAQLLLLEGHLREAVGEARLPHHLVFTTDPERGSLRSLARSQGIPTLDVPPAVGGRFSVLTPVGLYPAALLGVDIEGILRGAGEMALLCQSGELLENPAGLFAALLQEGDVERGQGIHVLFSYSDRLRTLGLWFQQLWGESLGKERDRAGHRVHVGPTPLPAVGAVDQHSLLQLLMEGPHDKVVAFLGTGGWTDPGQIPHLHPEEEGLAYLGGHTLGELLEVERLATAEALRRQGRPSLTLTVEGVNSRSIGALFMFFQIATVYAGALYGVDPLDQPGVELGKVLTYGMLGRPGYERVPLAAPPR